MTRQRRSWAVLGLMTALVLCTAGIAAAQVSIEYWHINSATFGGASPP